MKLTLFRKVFLSLTVAVFLSSAAAGSGINITTTILPFKHFIETVGGELVEVDVLISPGANPHTYEPTPGQLKDVSDAMMYVKVGSGVEFELAWMEKIIALNRNIVVCNGSDGLELLEMTEGNHTTHREEDEHRTQDDEAYDYQGKDPHVWLSPKNAGVIVKNIRDCLIQVDAENAEIYSLNADQYLTELELLDRKIREVLSSAPTKLFIVSHPAWGYFAHDYNLTQIAIEVEGKEPSPKHVAKVIETAREHNITTILVSPQSNPEIARVIADEIEGRIVYADPLAEHYIESLLAVADRIRRSNE